MASEYVLEPGVEPTSTVEISISCRNLLDMDVFSRSDPMCVVYSHPSGTSHWVEMLRTEIVWNCLNPEFVTKIIMDYRFEEEQPLRFEIYDIDSPSANLECHDFLGYAETNLAQVVSAGTTGLTLQLLQNKSKYYPILPKQAKQSKGSIVLHCEELHQFKEEVTIKVQGSGMGKSRCWLYRPKFFYVLSKLREETREYTVVYRSENVAGPQPTWASTTISVRSLANGDKDRSLQLQVWQVGFNGYHRCLGTLYTNLNQMQGQIGKQPVKLSSKNGLEKEFAVKFLQVMIAPVYTFMDYISNGTEIHCCFAIDFTASNGDPSDPNSLHHYSSTGARLNPYEQAIQAVGEIIQEYSHSKRFPVFGFGARVPPLGNVSHNFPLTFSDSPFCDGIDGVLEVYRSCLRNIQLFGPTNFAPIIREAAKVAERHMDGRHYYVLLIITDGIITDMQQTKEVIVESAKLPLSIIIAGVGKANFEAMQELDGDTVRLSFNGKFAERDIVQFVPYRDAYSWMATICPEVVSKWPAGSYDGSTSRLAKIRLAQEVLAEIPDQVTSFMKSRGITPGGLPHSLPSSQSNNNVARASSSSNCANDAKAN